MTSRLHFSFLSSRLLVPPASFQLLHVSRPSIFSLVILFSSFPLHMPVLPSPHANIIPFSNPSDRITWPKNPSFFFIAVCCSVLYSSAPISNHTLSLVFFSVHDIFSSSISTSYMRLSFSHFLCHCPRLTAIQSFRKISDLTILFSYLCSRVYLAIFFLLVLSENFTVSEYILAAGIEKGRTKAKITGLDDEREIQQT